MGEGRGEGDCAPKFELVCARALSTPFHKYNHVCGEGFLAQTRRERRAYPSGVCKERATRSGPKITAARRVASLFGSGFVAPRSQPHFGGCSLVAPRQNRKSTQQTGRSYETEYLATRGSWANATARAMELIHKPGLALPRHRRPAGPGRFTERRVGYRMAIYATRQLTLVLANG